MANQFTVNPLGGLSPASVIANLQGFNRQEDERNRLLQQERDQKMAFAQALDGTPESMQKLAETSPQMFQWMDQRNMKREQMEGAQQAAIKKQTEQDWLIGYKQALDSGDEEARQMMIQKAIDDPNNDLEHGAIGQNLENDKVITQAALFNYLGKEGYTNLYGKKSQDEGLPAEARAFNDLIKDFTPEQQLKAKKIKAGLKGRAMSNALLSSIEAGTVNSLKDAKAEIKQAEKFAEMTGSSRAKAIDKGFEDIKKIDLGLRNIDSAISALNRGAGVGAVEKLWPSIKAASVELDNIRGRMALDVVGAVTFGALSEGELKLAKNVALPTGLDTPELKDYLQRKKAAQQKLKAYYNEQIQFLDQGGTIAGFLRSKERGQSNPAAQPASTVNWSDL